MRKFLIFSLKKLFLYFGKGISKTLAYLELEPYLEPWYIQNRTHIHNTVKICNGTFCKNKYRVHFLSPNSKNKKSSYIFLYFGKLNFLTLILRKFLNFLKRTSFSYFENGTASMETPKEFLIFQETELFYILGNFVYFRK